MKRFWQYTAWFLAGGILGFIINTFLFQLWFHLDWRRPVAGWFVSLGFPTLAGYWGIVWLHIPDWIIVAAVGIWAGVTIRERLFLFLFLFGIGFVFLPLLISVLAGFNPNLFSGIVTLKALAWDGGTLIVLLLSGALSHRLKWKNIESNAALAK